MLFPERNPKGTRNAARVPSSSFLPSRIAADVEQPKHGAINCTQAGARGDWSYTPMLASQTHNLNSIENSDDTHVETISRIAVHESSVIVL